MKRALLTLMWLLSSAAAVGVAWAGVSVVDNQVVDPPGATVIAVSAQEQSDAGPSTAPSEPDTVAAVTSTDTAPETPSAPTTELASSPSDQSGAAAAPTTTRPRTNTAAATPTTQRPATAAATPTTQRPATAVATPTTQRPATTAAPTTTRPPATTAAPTTTRPPATTTTRPPATTAAPTTTRPPATTAAPTTRTFVLVGGTTQISFSPNRVTVLWATPNPGFSVEIDNDGSEAEVEFEADHHESRIEAWWSGGPQTRIREKPD